MYIKYYLIINIFNLLFVIYFLQKELFKKNLHKNYITFLMKIVIIFFIKISK